MLLFPFIRPLLQTFVLTSVSTLVENKNFKPNAVLNVMQPGIAKTLHTFGRTVHNLGSAYVKTNGDSELSG